MQVKVGTCIYYAFTLDQVILLTIEFNVHNVQDQNQYSNHNLTGIHNNIVETHRSEGITLTFMTTNSCSVLPYIVHW